MPRNKYPEETVQKILDAALKLFLEKGYEETTVLDIIGEMGGMTRGAFYHHFKSKEEVFDVLSEKLFAGSNPFADAKSHTELNGLQKIQFLLKKSITDTQTDSQKLSLSVLDLLESPTFLKKLIDTNTSLVPYYQEFISEGIDDGSIAPNNAKLLSELFTMFTNFWMIPTLFPSTEKETWERFMMIKEITDSLGFPVIDEELAELGRQQLEALDNADCQSQDAETD